jgi:hypothetical protein
MTFNKLIIITLAWQDDDNNNSNKNVTLKVLLRGFLSPFRQILGYCLKLGHHPVLSMTFRFITR